MKIKFSRLLYDVSEIKSTLLNCIIGKSDNKEIIFWVNELYVSGFKLWKFIWTVYYDFYAFFNQDKCVILMETHKQYNTLRKKLNVLGKEDNEKESDEIKLVLLKILCGTCILLKGMIKNGAVFVLKNKQSTNRCTCCM